MALKGKGNALKSIFGLMVVATALSGCGSSSTGSSSSTDSAANLASSTPTVNSAMGTIALSSSSYQVNASSSAIITVYRSGSGSGAASVNYTTVNGSALAGTDYTATMGTLTWNDGDFSSRTIAIPVSPSAQGTTFAVSLTSIEGQAGYGSPASATIQVRSTVAGTTPSGSSGTTNSNFSSSSSTTPSTKSASLSWSAPTENTNGSALTNLVGYNIYYGTSTGAMTNKIAISTVGITNYVIQNMQSGSWYFAMTAVNGSGAESTLTNTVQATL